MPNSTLFEDFCRSCGSLNTVELLEPPNSTHYARLSCSDCQAFIKWVGKPRIFEVSVTKLLQNPTLQTWEQRFLKTLIYRNPTEAEQIAIRAIEERVKTGT
jgi:hypothetical protein